MKFRDKTAKYIFYSFIALCILVEYACHKGWSTGSEDKDRQQAISTQYKLMEARRNLAAGLNRDC